MKKTVDFSDVDIELIEKIEEFGKNNNLSFSDAVIELCKIGLDPQSSLTWGEF